MPTLLVLSPSRTVLPERDGVARGNAAFRSECCVSFVKREAGRPMFSRCELRRTSADLIASAKACVMGSG